MEKTQLLLTFTKLSKLEETIEEIKNCYQLFSDKIFVLQDVNNSKELICSYNICENSGTKTAVPPNTISVHRKKESNTIYTINALNYIIALLNDGVQDASFQVDWNNYKNMILVTNPDGVRKIPTKIFEIIKV